MEALRDAALGPWNGVGLVAAHDEAAHLLLEVDEAVGIAQGGKIARHAGNGLGDHVLVLERLQRHGNARHAADLPGPLPGAIDHDLALDGAARGGDARGAALLEKDAGHRAILDDAHAALAGTLGEG